MAKHAGIARFTYNWGLATWQDLYNNGLKPNKYLLKKFFNNHVKPELTWIKEKGICQKITQYAFDNLGESFQRFFKGQSKYPNFKKKGKNDSFTIDNGGKPIPVGGTSIKLPTIGWVKFYEFKRQLEYKAKKFGCQIIIADRFYPSSKTCSHCGYKKNIFVYLKEFITVRTAVLRWIGI